MTGSPFRKGLSHGNLRATATLARYPGCNWFKAGELLAQEAECVQTMSRRERQPVGEVTMCRSTLLRRAPRLDG